MSVASSSTHAVEESAEMTAAINALVARLRSPAVSLVDIAQGVAALAQGVLDKEKAKIVRAEKAKEAKESGVVRKPRQTKGSQEIVGEAPDASDYRIESRMIRGDLCKGRRFAKKVEERWSKPVFYEEQCTLKPIEGEEMCVGCVKRQKVFAEDPAKGAGTKTAWAGRIDEEPLDTTHMIGTAWANALRTSGKLKWQGFVKEKKVREKKGGAASVTSRTSAKADPEPDDASAPVTDEPTEEALGHAILAILKSKTDEELSVYTPTHAREELSAKYGTVKDFKEVVKTAVKAGKEAIDAQRLAKAKAPKPKPVKTTAAKPVKPAGMLKFVDGDQYWVLENGNAYAYDVDTKVVGDFMGVFDPETGELDTDAIAA